jgi:uncharacterized membrane protein
MDETGQDGSARGRGRWLRLALVLSLAANLAVVGMAVGVALTKPGPGEHRDGGRRGGDRPPAALRELGPAPYFAALSQPDRAALLEAAGAREGDLRQSREALRARFEEMLALLRAETFDAAAMGALLAGQRAEAARRQELGEALLIERFAEMSAEERAAYAERLDTSLRRPGPRRP